MKKVMRNSRGQCWKSKISATSLYSKNKAQMEISFGTIFSILLIIVFIAFAFFGIKKFMVVQEDVLAKKFISDLNGDIEKMWQSSRGSQEVTYFVPKKVESVCFGEKNSEYEDDSYNIYFLPEEELDTGNLKKVDFETTLNGEEELCIEAEKSKISFVIDKFYGETLVTISKQGRKAPGNNYGSGECEGNPGEILLGDETFTFEEGSNEGISGGLGHGFSLWKVANSPSNWFSPYNYYDGEIYERYEIISQASDRSSKLQFGIWQNGENGESCVRELMSDLNNLNGAGDVVEVHSSPATWWKSEGDGFTVNFNHPETFCYVGVPLWSDNRKLVSDWVKEDSDWELRDDYLPMTVRATIVAVPKDGEFSGWDCWINGGGEKDFYIGEAQNHGTYQDILNNPEFKVLFNIDFENRPYLGKYKTLAEFRSDWKTSWGNRGEELEIVIDPVDSNNKVALMTFPFWDSPNFKWICWGDGCSDSESRRIYFDEEPTFARYRELLDGVGPASGGGTWYIPLGGKYDEVYLSYNIKYEPDWAAPAGGKLPGFTTTNSNTCGACLPTDCMDEQGNKYDLEWNEQTKKWDSEPPQDGIADDFTAKHMFHGNTHISYYIYDADKVNVCGDSYGVSDSMIYDGNWHNIVLRVKMNTPDVANGIVETWIDGKNHGAVTDILFRTGYAKFGIDSISFSNFFGGSGSPCSDIENRFKESCARGEWYDWIEDWVRVCAVDPTDPCSDILRYSDGTPQTYWNNRKTEYIHFDDIIAYTYA